MLTNVAKRFLDLLGKYFPPNNKFHKILNRITVKVSYFGTPSVGSIIKIHNEKLTNSKNKQTKDWNCRNKEESLLNGRSEGITYKYVVRATGHPRKVYSGTAEGDNLKKSFKNQK